MSSTGAGYAGPYRLLNVVNSGQTTQVWQAYHDRSQMTVALKILLDDYARDRDQIQYLKWEYQVAGKINHERIIRVYRFGKERGTVYLAMEYFQAPNLKYWTRQGPQAVAPIAKRLMLQASEAVLAFNRCGWVHCDVKPDNFLATEQGQVKLIDFALARRPKKGIARLLARKSRVQGTRSYMSPEQIRGQPLDERADIYSLGCTFFEILTGRPPFTGFDANDLLMQHLRTPVPWLKTRNPNVTAQISEFIRIAMAKKAENRQNSLEDFLGELKSVAVFEPGYEPEPAARRSAR